MRFTPEGGFSHRRKPAVGLPAARADYLAAADVRSNTRIYYERNLGRRLISHCPRSPTTTFIDLTVQAARSSVTRPHLCSPLPCLRRSPPPLAVQRPSGPRFKGPSQCCAFATESRNNSLQHFLILTKMLGSVQSLVALLSHFPDGRAYRGPSLFLPLGWGFASYASSPKLSLALVRH
jgi:hypothetical protein